MKGIKMKAMALMLVFVFSTATFAQTLNQEQFINTAKANYLRSLKSDVNGVVESTIFILIEMKERYPELNYNNVVEKLDELVSEGNTPTIRYKAQLASLYIKYTNVFAGLKIKDKSNPDGYFKELSNRLVQADVAVN